MDRVFKCVVIKTTRQSQANADAVAYDPVGGRRTFTVPLYPVGLPQVAPTHYWAGIAFRADTWARVKQAYQAWINSGDAWVFDLETYTPEVILAELGLERKAMAG